MNKINLFFFIFLFTITLNAQVKVSLKNKTGEKIDSVFIENIFVGVIEKDSIKTVTFEKIMSDSGNLNIRVSAIIGKEKFETKTSYQCATFIKTVTQGDYERDITLFSNDEYGKNILILRN